MRAYIYCTKAKPMLRIAKEPLFKHQDRARTYTLEDVKGFTQYIVEDMYEANGKIVACFDLDKVEKMGLDSNNGLVFNCGFNEESQLSLKEIVNYVGDNYYYAWHIDNLQVFDKPMELSDFNGLQNTGGMIFLKELKSAPQSWGYATLDKDVGFGFLPNVCILISIKPEWVEKILNGKKTIEVRKTCPIKFKGE